MGGSKKKGGGEGAKGREKARPAVAMSRTDPARERAKEERDRRVDHIVNEMARGEWSGARSTILLAAEWGCSKHAVSEYAREASGIIRRLVAGDPDDVRAEIVAGIERLRLIATEATKFELVGFQQYEERRAPNVDAALRAYELRAKVLGLLVQNVKVTEEIAKLPDDELRRQYDEMKARIAKS